jgi:hypothetical protein
MERGNRVWRYPIPPGADDDPARAAFVTEAQARISEQSLQARRRQAARKASESLRAKLKAAGIDPHAYYSMLAARGNAARWGKQHAATPQAECAPAPPQASQAAARITQAAAGQAQAQDAEAPEARQSTPRRTGTLPVYLL